LAGIAINALLASVNGFLLLVSGSGVIQIVNWLSGGFSGRGWNEFFISMPFSVAGIIAAVLLSKEMNLLYLGEEIAMSLGLNVKLIQRLSIALASLLAAAAVSVAGIISFVGLIIPNISRLIIGNDYKYNLICSLLLGGIFVVISDILARTIIAPSELPAGIFTSFIGAPVFIWLIFKKQNENG
jgi:iron complex transport system permease protein